MVERPGGVDVSEVNALSVTEFLSAKLRRASTHTAKPVAGGVQFKKTLKKRATIRLTVNGDFSSSRAMVTFRTGFSSHTGSTPWRVSDTGSS